MSSVRSMYRPCSTDWRVDTLLQERLFLSWSRYLQPSFFRSLAISWLRSYVCGGEDPHNKSVRDDNEIEQERSAKQQQNDRLRWRRWRQRRRTCVRHGTCVDSGGSFEQPLRLLPVIGCSHIRSPLALISAMAFMRASVR